MSPGVSGVDDARTGARHVAGRYIYEDRTRWQHVDAILER